jgi:hypothetical protein
VSGAWRMRISVLALLPLLSLRAAEAPAPGAPGAEEPPVALPEPPADAGSGDRAPPRRQEDDEAPVEPISADNNLTFPVDI